MVSMTTIQSTGAFSTVIEKCNQTTPNIKSFLRLQQTITQEMAEQGLSDLDVAFAMILFPLTFYLVSYEARIHKLASNSF